MFFTGHDRLYTVPPRLQKVLGSERLNAWSLLAVPEEARTWADAVLNKLGEKLTAHNRSVLHADDGEHTYFGVPDADEEDLLSTLLRETDDGMVQMYHGSDGWTDVADATEYSMIPLEELDEDTAALLADALVDGGKGLVQRYTAPLAWLPPTNDHVPASTSLAASGEEWRTYALVDDLDPGAVLNLVRLAPGPKLEEYVQGDGWTANKELLTDITGVSPPTLVELDEEKLKNVISQIDSVVAAVSPDPRAEKLRRYWSIGGKGGLKIRWNTPGDWTRCYRYLRKYMGPRAKGYCANMHKRNTGTWPGRRGSVVAGLGDSVVLGQHGMTQHVFIPGETVTLVASTAAGGYRPLGDFHVIDHDGETLRVGFAGNLFEDRAGLWSLTAGGLVRRIGDETLSEQTELLVSGTAECDHSLCASYRTWPKLSTEAALDAALTAGAFHVSDGKETETMRDGIYTEVVEKDTEFLHAMTAGGAFPANPPDDWFENPKLEGPTPLTIDPSGRVFGHIASFDVAHIGLPGKVHAPRSKSGYAYFHTGEVVTASGKRVPVGQLTLSGGHAPLSADAAAAVEHYDDTNSGVADLSVGEDKWGIWAAGALRPSVSEEQVRTIRASAPSGDWRPINGSLELVAVCQVNVPGFPITRARVASGAVMALVAAGARPLAELKMANEVNEALADKVAKLETALIAAGVLTADAGEVEVEEEEAPVVGEVPATTEEPAEVEAVEEEEVVPDPEASAEEETEPAAPEASTDEDAPAEDDDYDYTDPPEASERVTKLRAEIAARKRREELREQVRQGTLAAGGGDSPKAHSLSASGVQAYGLTAARSWRAWLHPRGRNGRFIEKFSFVNIFENSDGSGRSYRAKVVDLSPSGMKVEYMSRQGRSLGSPSPKFPTEISADDITKRVSAAPRSVARLDDAPKNRARSNNRPDDFEFSDNEGRVRSRATAAKNVRESLVPQWQRKTNELNNTIDDSKSLNGRGEGISTEVDWDNIEVDMSRGVEAAFQQISDQLDPAFREQQQFVAETVAKAEASGLNIESFLTDPANDASWPAALREYGSALSNDIIATAEKAGVPKERKALVLGGLPGAGKTTMIRNMGMDPDNWIMLNPDDIKERMIADGIFPEIKGLSPMESVGVMHEFSSFVAKQATKKAMASGFNVIHDVTLANDRAAGKIEKLNEEWGYEADAVFVDVSMEMSAKSQIKRHLGGLNKLRAGEDDEGGRYVPTRVLGASQSDDPEYRSTNAKAFENFKNSGAFRRWTVIDNNNYANVPLAVGQRVGTLPGDPATLLEAPANTPGVF